MKKLNTYNLFTEGVKDLMTPKSEKEIRNTLESKPPKDKIEFGIYKDIPWLVQQGVEEGADIMNNGDFLLGWATEKGLLPLVKLLIDKGVNIHTEDDKPLRNACYLGYIDIVKYLIDKGANVNADRGYTLGLPVQRNYYDITELLLKSGADKSPKLNYAYKIAKERKFDDIAELIKKYMKVNEGVRDKMTPKSEDDIVKGFETADVEDLLKSSFDNNSMIGLKYILDNYKLYGKETKFIIYTKLPKIENKDDMEYLLNNDQIIKFLNSEQIYVLEKYVLGLHQDELRYYEQTLLKQLDNTDFYQSKHNPDIMIGKNKKGDKNYFNYNKKTHLLTYHLDNMSSWLVGKVDEDDNYKPHRESDYKNEDNLGWYYDDLIMMGILGKHYNIKIDQVIGSRNDDYSFVKE